MLSLHADVAGKVWRNVTGQIHAAPIYMDSLSVLVQPYLLPQTCQEAERHMT